MAEIEKNFSGIWKLNEWSVEKPDGKKTYPFSGNVSGYLMYHPNGWMSANLMQNDRINISDDRLKISKISHLLKNKTEISFEGDLLETIKNFFMASNGYVSYAGTFNADDSNVYHNIELSLLPQWVGTTLTRKHSFSSKNSLLTLSAEFNGFKDLLIWKKV
jgi:hypothetical protein|tara:strand:+ start:1604 stop:2086 length:483 start_codon:yes stop_codon:yes gene_type:complete